ncbi:hypothetical protein NG798_24195 [Ancylothrix sp. C2]|uniref:hypothetical protein n=1 Tax=Ancylothrix sp. D3o TaxID=2953691 RepID=UPI0021BB81CD|nr:hypothetical protein [Ancylothrix sp. D3o]MCT7952905.1 hypothetical protein [Ancylothrix sp. D3o]
MPSPTSKDFGNFSDFPASTGIIGLPASTGIIGLPASTGTTNFPNTLNLTGTPRCRPVNLPGVGDIERLVNLLGGRWDRRMLGGRSDLPGPLDI